MNKQKSTDYLTNSGITIGILVSRKQKQMLEELASKEDSSMNRIVRRMIEKEYLDYISDKVRNKEFGGEHE